MGIIMVSVWTDSISLPRFQKLTGDISADVLIIGGGIAGILCSYMLKEKGVSSVLVEARRIADGTTKNTTAKITAQHGLIYSKLILKFGREKAGLYLEAQNRALEKYRALCAVFDCDFEEKDAFVYSLSDRKKIEDELLALDKLGCSADFVKDLPLPFSAAGAVRFKNQAQFNPLKFLFEISKNLTVYENTKVKELAGTTAITEGGKIKAKKIIAATHFPFINKHGSYYLKMYQHRSYVLALEKGAQINGMYLDEKEKGMSFRNYKDYLFVGGGDHRTGKKGGSWAELEEFAKRYYPDKKIAYRFAAQDCMTLDGAPYIGRYSKNTPDLFVLTGFNKWGMTSSMAGADILSDMILGRANPYEEVFSPSRTILRPQLLVNGFEAVASILTPTAPRCPHMGCALKWNKAERSYDCPCHGSRFTEKGELIDNPSTGDLK